MNRTVNIALVAAALVVAASAYADSPSPEAAQAFREAKAAFDAGRYDEAIVAWQRSYDLSKLPALLYDLAQAYRLRAHPGDCASALERYQGYVASAAPSHERTLAEGYISARCSVDAVRPVAVVPDRATSERGEDHARTERLAGTITAGTGVALLVTGIAMGKHAQTLGDHVTSACNAGCDWPTVKPTDDAGRRDATLGRVFDVVGGAGIVGGAALYYLGMRSEVAVAPIATAHDSGAVLTWSGSW